MDHQQATHQQIKPPYFPVGASPRTQMQTHFGINFKRGVKYRYATTLSTFPLWILCRSLRKPSNTLELVHVGVDAQW